MDSYKARRIKQALCLILFLTLLFGTIKIAHAEGIILTIIVVDSNDNPIQGAKVTVTPDGGTQTTDNEGKATFILWYGKYTIKVEKEGYKTVEDEVDYSSWASTGGEVKIRLLKEGEEGEGGIIWISGAVCGLDRWDDIPDGSAMINPPNFFEKPIQCICLCVVKAILWICDNIIEIIFDVFKMLFGWFRNLFIGLTNLLQGWGIAAPFALAISFMVIFGVLAIFFRILWWIYDKIPII